MNTINLSPEAVSAIEALQHNEGTFHYYSSTLKRLQAYVLHFSDEIGMSDTEAVHTLRVLDAIHSDFKAIAGKVASASETEIILTTEEVAARIDNAFEDVEPSVEITETSEADN